MADQSHDRHAKKRISAYAAFQAQKASTTTTTSSTSKTNFTKSQTRSQTKSSPSSTLPTTPQCQTPQSTKSPTNSKAKKQKMTPSTEDTDVHSIQNLQELFKSTPHIDSAQEALKYFEWLISPIKVDHFFRHLFERKPLLLHRHDHSYSEGLFSSSELDKILKQNDIQFTRNLDVTSYVDGQRETHNPEGRALAPVVWDYYQNGCSIRMLNPQTYSTAVWKLNSTLQEYFGCLVGANIYLTPAGTQGFAPHYDDIEAFVLQLEGKKHWRLYQHRNEKEILPRYSSGNFKQTDIGKPILDCILEPGDLLYFPKGMIHQANALEDTHSLHITLSACQKNSWGDFLEKLVPRALQVAREEDVEFRHSIPRDYLNYMGIAFADKTHPKRLEFLQKVSQLMMKLAFYAPIDAAADKMAMEYMHEALPPVLSEEESSCNIIGSPTCCREGVVVDQIELTDDTEIRLMRRGIVRLISDGNQVYVYHTLENARKYHGKEPQFIEVPVEAGPAIEHLLHTYPEYVTIDSLPLTGQYQDQQVELAQKLYETGIIVTKSPLQPISEEDK